MPKSINILMNSEFMRVQIYGFVSIKSKSELFQEYYSNLLIRILQIAFSFKCSGMKKT